MHRYNKETKKHQSVKESRRTNALTWQYHWIAISIFTSVRCASLINPQLYLPDNYIILLLWSKKEYIQYLLSFSAFHSPSLQLMDSIYTSHHITTIFALLCLCVRVFVVRNSTIHHSCHHLSFMPEGSVCTSPVPAHICLYICVQWVQVQGGKQVVLVSSPGQSDTRESQQTTAPLISCDWHLLWLRQLLTCDNWRLKLWLHFSCLKLLQRVAPRRQARWWAQWRMEMRGDSQVPWLLFLVHALIPCPNLWPFKAWSPLDQYAAYTGSVKGVYV